MNVAIELKNTRSLFLWSLALLATISSAQTGAVSTAEAGRGPLPTNLHYQSAISGYKSYSDQKVLSWREANDRVGQIGGWRAYAKEASLDEIKNMAPVSTDSHSGHHEEGKP
ncbi:hypothetical protein B9Z44_02405 [Limnohabitans curvus]|uniref:Uncharacterized protein n=1 Tax=Limnohabitans curvus TaxID=323423 RepID=A0A315EMS1_9BURK|nr:hypothetical protein [Limnohabitans curvus]PUE58551.1 hypothetical protein B9Z44_02405 [Limnohabitans curvus]